MYYATYTAYNGRAILPQLIETQDFLSFRVLTLNGSAVQNKGMALFPRRIAGRYAMLSRQDDENLVHHVLRQPALLERPATCCCDLPRPGNPVKVGNCGSPLETDAGWLVITHGVGPMRKYCIGGSAAGFEGPDEGHWVACASLCSAPPAMSGKAMCPTWFTAAGP